MEQFRNRRLKLITTTALIAATIVSVALIDMQQARRSQPVLPPESNPSSATRVLASLPARVADSKAGYSRKKYSDGWAKVGTCTVRDKILARDMTAVLYRSPGDCTVISGTLADPYTGKIIHFIRGSNTSGAVQIDHVVAISDTWQTGAQKITKQKREQLYNDPLELIAVDGPSNEEKGDGDAAAWLPPNTSYDCRYVARQIAVKFKYHFWVTPQERSSMEKVLETCPGQLLPSVKD